MKIEVEYFDDCGELYTPLLTNGGLLCEEDGRVKLHRV